MSDFFRLYGVQDRIQNLVNLYDWFGIGEAKTAWNAARARFEAWRADVAADGGADGADGANESLLSDVRGSFCDLLGILRSGDLTRLDAWSDGFAALFTPEDDEPDEVGVLLARPVDGVGANEDHPDWGATDSALLRLANDDRGPNGEMSGADRPNAREVSNAVARQDGETTNAAGASDFLWIWGQFLDHDLSLTEAGDEELANIAVPAGDPFFDPFGTGAAVIPFTRVATHDGEYVNEITSYIDASMIYGSDAETVDKMRIEGGKLLMTEDAQLALEGANLVTGDVRAAENVLLSSMHTIFTREHNRIVDEMAAADAGLDDAALFDGARARVEGIVQAITYNEFLPILIGEDALSAYQGYDAAVNPGVSVEFSTAVFRLGHTLLSSDLQRVGEDGAAGEALSLSDAFFRPSLLSEEGLIEDMLRGAATQTAEAVDTTIVEDVRSFLFGPPGAGGLDLAALNIQRGRDLGVASYNDLREAVGLARRESFEEITSDADLARRLEATYGDVDLVDAWVGGLAEDAVGDGLLGEMFSTVMIDQFTRLRDGDPFWSAGRDGLGAEEVEAIWSTTLSDVILRNTDIAAIQDDVFTAMERIVGTEDADWLAGDDGAEFVFGAGGADRLWGRKGDDDLQGGDGNDRLFGGRGDDSVDGGDGDDRIRDGRGDDVATGGAGRDLFIYNARAADHDRITDFEIGVDKLALKNGWWWWGVDIDQRDDDVVVTLARGGTITLEDAAPEFGHVHSWDLFT